MAALGRLLEGELWVIMFNFLAVAISRAQGGQAGPVQAHRQLSIGSARIAW